MEANRLELSSVLHEILESCGEPSNVYFQPPESVKLLYPCIIYHLKNLPSSYADDEPYHKRISFDITYITRSPSSKVPDALLSLPMTAFDRYYTAENLHHYVYTNTSTLRSDNQ